MAPWPPPAMSLAATFVVIRVVLRNTLKQTYMPHATYDHVGNPCPGSHGNSRIAVNVYREERERQGVEGRKDSGTEGGTEGRRDGGW